MNTYNLQVRTKEEGQNIIEVFCVKAESLAIAKQRLTETTGIHIRDILKDLVSA